MSSYLGVGLVHHGCEPAVHVAERSPEGGVHHLGQINKRHETTLVFNEMKQFQCLSVLV